MVRRLAGRILSGELRPGTYLPNTAELGKELGVSRTALREVVRVLGAKGLVETSPRTGSRIRPPRDWNLLDPELLDWSGPSIEPGIVANLIEFRELMEPDAAALAAERATAAQLAVIEDAFGRMQRALPDDIAACCQADLDFHVGLLRATGNLMLSQLASVISATLLASFERSTSLSGRHTAALAAHREVMEAIRLRSPSRARQAMLGLLRIAARDLAGSGPPRPVRAHRSSGSARTGERR